jgi:hypothetical protein
MEEDRRRAQATRREEVRTPPRPKPQATHPSKRDGFVALLREFQFYHPDLRVKAILADAL